MSRRRGRVRHEDWANDPEFEAYAQHVIDNLVPVIDGSGATVSMVPKNGDKTDVKFAVELGFSIMFDKPLILMVQPGTKVPNHLRRAADAIIEYDPERPGDVSQRIEDALNKMPRRT